MKTWKVQHANTKTLAGLFEVDTKIFRKWIKPFKKEIGIRLGIYFTARQVGIIFEKIGLPPNVEIVFPGEKKAS